MTKNKKRKAYNRGLLAECLASIYLQLCGYRILERRYKTPFGEIDLVAAKRRTLVMIEVKIRSNAQSAIEAISSRNRRRVADAANYFLAAHPGYAGYDMRFDAIVMGLPFYWRHLDNAWEGRT